MLLIFLKKTMFFFKNKSNYTLNIREQFNSFTIPLSSQKLSQKLFLPHPKTVHAQENFSLIYDYLLCMLIFFLFYGVIPSNISQKTSLLIK
jgi:hypothetical protein